MTLRGAAALALVAGLFAQGCASEASEDVGGDEGAVTLDTSSAQARAQYDANVSFVSGYTTQCAPRSDRPRVVLVGFGRFTSGGAIVTDNASGLIVSALVPAVRYPETRPPRAGRVDDPAPQVRVAQAEVALDGYGTVDVCAMILPVSWDLAAVLVAKEVDAFRPSFVLMNGVAAARQPVWIELGAVNRGNGSYDGSSSLRPALQPGESSTKLLDEASEDEEVRGNLVSWEAVLTSARAARERHASERAGGARFGDIAPDVILPGFPRATGTFVCNSLSYATGWLMDHPGEEANLMRATPEIPGAVNAVPASIASDLREVPRVFVHWPQDLRKGHTAAAADVMSAIVTGQLRALDAGDAPTRGDRSQADPSARGGDYY